MKITKNEIKKVLKEIRTSDVQHAAYGNGEPCTFQRIIKENAEFTLVDDKLYVGTIGATVTRIKEGRREDSLVIDGKKAKFANLIANNIEDDEIFFTFGKPFGYYR